MRMSKKFPYEHYKKGFRWEVLKVPKSLGYLDSYVDIRHLSINCVCRVKIICGLYTP